MKAARISLAAILAAGALVALVAFAGVGAASDSASISQYQYGGSTRVTICHKSHVTITVDAHSLRAHLKHGDSLGPCTGSSPKPTRGHDTNAGPGGRSKTVGETSPADETASTPPATGSTSTSDSTHDGGNGGGQTHGGGHGNGGSRHGNGHG